MQNYNPNQRSDLSPAVEKLIQSYLEAYWTEQPKEGVVTIHVDEVASKVATFYEKIREIVDWKEEHLMRRMAIERILKRRLFLEKYPKGAAEPFVLELIRGGHFPNDQIERTKIEDIQYIIDKYSFILQNSPKPTLNKTKAQLYNFLLGIAACEVEETLNPASYIKANGLIEFMEEDIKSKIKIGPKARAQFQLSQREIDLLTYVAVQQALLKLDAPLISYNILKRQYKDFQALPPKTLEEITLNIYLIWEGIEKILSHPLSDRFYRICERYDTPYLILGDIISSDLAKAEENLLRPEILDKLIEEAYQKRYSTLRSRCRRAAFYATLSIFLSNVAVMYLIEVPIAKYVTEFTGLAFTRFSMLINVLAPTFLMFLLVTFIRLPRKENLDLVKKEIYKILQKEKKDIYEVELYPKRGLLAQTIFGLLYFVTFLICFGAMTYGMYYINYPPFSYLIMYMFISLIAFAGVRIRQRARELDVTEEKESIFNLIVDPFALPVIRLGRWLMARWQKINIVAVIFNYLIEMPFLIFIEFLEAWRYYIRERKEAIR